MKKIVFVAAELFPFTAGGIGRVIHNMLKCMTEADRARTVVVGMFDMNNVETFSAVFPGVELVRVDQDDTSGRHGVAHVPPRHAFTNSDFHWRSWCVLRSLKALSKKSDIEYVEFADWGALAFATLQERNARGFLWNTTLAIRLHGSHSVLLATERYVVGRHDLNLFDLERKSLRDCDIIIAQVAPYAEVCRKVFGFGEDEWNSRLVVHSPPVLIDNNYGSQSAKQLSQADLLFTSKFQHIKRPDLFVRGVNMFFSRNETYQGKAVFCAHQHSSPYVSEVMNMIPARLGHRFTSLTNPTNVERDALIASSIVIIPGTCESYCLAAYEASLLGASVCLNADNPAFGDDTPWIEGVNCFKFKSTAISLADAIERATSAETKLSAVEIPVSPWPWEVAPKTDRVWVSTVNRPLVSVVITHYNLGKYVLKCIESVVDSDYPNIEIVLIDDCSTDFASVQIIETLLGNEDLNLRVVRLESNIGLAAARNYGIEQTRGDYILTLDADDLIHPDFLTVAVEALENSRDFDVIVSHAGLFPDGTDVPLPHSKDDMEGYSVFVGEAKMSGLTENRFSTSAAVFRRSVFAISRYDDALDVYEDWSLYLALCDRRVRFIVLNEVYFFYRHRRNSMIHRERDLFQRAYDHQSLMRSSAPSILSNHSYFLAIAEGFNGRQQEYDLRGYVEKLEIRARETMGYVAPKKVHAERMSQISLTSAVTRRTGLKGNLTRLALTPFVRNAQEREKIVAAVDRSAKSRAYWVIKESGMFDEDWYRDFYPDVAASQMDPIDHYLRYGAAEGRDPNPYFSSSRYLQANHDVWMAGVNPLLHYIEYGIAEKRRIL